MAGSHSSHLTIKQKLMQAKARTIEMAKNGFMGATIGATSGAAIGSAILGVGYLMIGNCDYANEAGCKRENSELNCYAYCNTPDTQKALDAAVKSAEDHWIGRWQPIVLGSMAAGAGIGFLAGLYRGYHKALPQRDMTDFQRLPEEEIQLESLTS